MQDVLPAAATLISTGFVMCVSAAFFALALYDFGPTAMLRGMLASVALSLLLAGPLSFAASLKLRDLSHVNQKLNQSAATDSLTGCLNRGAFVDTINRFLSDNAAGGALLVIDADHFKVINDRFGHDHGDEALFIIAAAIRSALRANDIVGRLGGEEFGVLLPGVDQASAEQIAERIRKKVNLSVFIPLGELHQLSVSIGGIRFEPGAELDELYHLADRNLYEAKHYGRNRTVIGALAGRRKAATIRKS